MTFSLAQLLGLIIAYLSTLFAIGYLADRGHISQRISGHPAVFVLSLGVFAGAMATNSAGRVASEYGYSYLLYYLGAVIMFILAPLLLHPIYRICRIYQLGSLADLLAFRFRSPGVGALVTLAMLTALMPLLAMQINVVSDSIHLLAGNDTSLGDIQRSPESLALFFCAIITLFTMLFGTRQVSPNQQHRGLVTAIAFESLLKLVAFLVLGIAAVYSVFDGFLGLQQWLETDPRAIEIMQSPLRDDAGHSMLLTFFAGAIVMPHIFHMAITENPGGGRFRIASWGLPLYLLLLSLPVLPIAWAAMKLDTALPADHAALTLGLGLGNAPLALYAFFACLSAASAVVIVSTLALANMCLNHLVLPTQLHRFQGPRAVGPDIYLHLRWLRRGLIAAIILAAYAFYRVVHNQPLLIEGGSPFVMLGLTAFTGTLQLMPATVATVYWPGANKKGLLAGLIGGGAIWALALMVPMTSSWQPQIFWMLPEGWLSDKQDLWNVVAVSSLIVNIGLFMLVSMLSRTTEEERISAEICSMDDLNRPMRQQLQLNSVAEFRQGLSGTLGPDAAAVEVDTALSELQLLEGENRPYALRQLRARLEANLSGLLGPAVAWDILQRSIPMRPRVLEESEDISLIEQRLDSAKVEFTGLAADLDNLRRYHRETLQQLPIGVLSLGHDGEVLMWNGSMEQLTGVQAENVVGSDLTTVPEQWRAPLLAFADSDKTVEHRLPIPSEMGGDIWVSLHKAAVESSARTSEDRVIVVEDLTDYQLLENELLHNERLASIGRLAAGVAHEIGNPVTGISSLAQNLAYEEDVDIIQASASDILRQTERVSRIVESLVNFSHAGRVHGAEPTLQAMNLADCVDEAVHLLELDKAAKPVQFMNHCNREHLVMADSQKLLQVFVNLLANARDASPEDETIEVDSRDQDDSIHIELTDRGSGIPAEIQGQIFEPFFTTKETGEGTGLGLALVYSIVEDLDGYIQVESPVMESGEGSRFTLRLQRGEYAAEYQ